MLEGRKNGLRLYISKNFKIIPQTFCRFIKKWVWESSSVLESIMWPWKNSSKVKQVTIVFCSEACNEWGGGACCGLEIGQRSVEQTSQRWQQCLIWPAWELNPRPLSRLAISSDTSPTGRFVPPWKDPVTRYCLLFRIGMARACWLLSNAYSSLGNYTKALEFTQEQLLISTEVRLSILRSNVCGNFCFRIEDWIKSVFSSSAAA